MIFDDPIINSIKLSEKLRSLEVVERNRLNKKNKEEEENIEPNLLKKELNREI
tara:strand:+ start:662 stop:820 length:159 start_codon:yes stop_codon:yes gene_type:complete